MYLRHLFFFFQAEDGIRDLTVTGVQTCALPISGNLHSSQGREIMELFTRLNQQGTTIIQVTHSEENAKVGNRIVQLHDGWITSRDRKSTRLNSSHSQISYAVFCLKKKK